MDTHWIVTLIAIIPFWFLQNVIHELSHGLTIKLGWKYDFSIYPFPSNKLGRFTWAHFTYTATSESKEPNNEGWALVHIMPKLVNILFILVSTILAAAISNNTATMLLLVFAWTNFIDFFTGMLSGIKFTTKKTDLKKFQEKLNISNRALQIAAIGDSIIMAIPVVLSTLVQFLS